MLDVVGIPDIARLARNTATDAAQAARPGLLRGVEHAGLVGGARGRLATVEKLERSLRDGIEAGTVVGGEQLATQLDDAAGALRDSLEALRAPDATGIGWGRFVPMQLGPSANAHHAVELLEAAASHLDSAAATAANEAIDGVRLITPETSPTVVHAGDVLRAAPHDPAVEAAIAAVDPAWLEFSPDAQRRFMRVFDRTAGRLVGTRHEGLEHVVAGRQAIYTSTHPSYLDPTAVLQGIHRGGGDPPRAMAAPHVTALLRGPGRRMGVFPTKAPDFNGLDGARAMLRHGQSIEIFPEGNVYALHAGSSGEPRTGISLLATETGVPLVPSAGYGHQGRRVTGAARGAQPVIVFGEPVRFQPMPPNATEAEKAAYLAEVGEVYAQRHDRLLQRAVASYGS